MHAVVLRLTRIPLVRVNLNSWGLGGGGGDKSELFLTDITFTFYLISGKKVITPALFSLKITSIYIAINIQLVS